MTYKAIADCGIFLFKILISFVTGMITTMFCAIMGISDFKNGGFTVTFAILVYVYMTYLFSWLQEKKANKDLPKIERIRRKTPIIINPFPRLTDDQCEKIGLHGTRDDASAHEMRLTAKGAQLARDWYDEALTQIAKNEQETKI